MDRTFDGVDDSIWPLLPYDEPLPSEHEVARTLRFNGADDPRYVEWEKARADPRLPAPDLTPRCVLREPPLDPPHRRPGWDIHRPNGGQIDLGAFHPSMAGYWESDDPVTPKDVREVCRRSGIDPADEAVIVADAAAAWRRHNAPRKVLYIVAKAGVLDVRLAGGVVEFVPAKKRGG